MFQLILTVFLLGHDGASVHTTVVDFSTKESCQEAMDDMVKKVESKINTYRYISRAVAGCYPK